MTGVCRWPGVLLLAFAVMPETALAQAPDADALFAAGRLAEATAAYAGRLRADPTDPIARLRSGLLALWSNRTAAADSLLSSALRADPGDRTALEGLAETYAREGRFAEAAPLLRELGRTAKADEFAALGDAYALTLPAEGVRLAFASGAVLPVLDVRVNGRSASFLLDTGAGETILDPALASEVGVRTFGADSATFAAGRVGSFEHGILDSLSLGGATVREVPVVVQSTTAYAPAAGGRAVGGILGTGLLSRFRATIDFGREVLELRARGGEASATDGVALPFWLLGDHFVTLHATVAGSVETLVVFDTGLAMPGGGFVPAAWVLDAAGVHPAGAPMTGVGGGGPVQVTPFTLGRLSAGPLERSDVLAVAGAFPPVLERRFGPRIGGLVSHGFFTGQRVTLDFEAMRLVVEGDGAAAVARASAGTAAGPDTAAAARERREPGAAPDPTRVALEVVRLLRAGSYDEMKPYWSGALLERLPPAALGQAWTGVVAQLGEVTEVRAPQPGTGQDGRSFVKVPVRFGKVLLAVTVFFDADGRVNGVAMQPE